MFDPNLKGISTVNKNLGPYMLGQTVDKNKTEGAVIKQHINVDADGGGNHVVIYSPRTSFSYRVCKDQKSRSSKSGRRRPASLDLNTQAMNVTSSSPRLGSVVQTSASARRRCMFPSPGTPGHDPGSFGAQKGWSSERVPLHKDGSRIPLMPFSNGKALPSKWEDAERWIISPVAGENAALRSSGQQQKRPKSKSGPLGPHGSACYSVNSPVVPDCERGGGTSIVTKSSVLTRVSADCNMLTQCQNGNFSSVMDKCIARSVSLHGCADLPSDSLLRVSKDDKIGGSINVATNISHDVSRRDMATQMSPESSSCSSMRKTTSSSTVVIDLQRARSSKSEIRDVQIDDKVTLTPYAKKGRGHIPDRGSNMVDDCENEHPEMRKSLSKVMREEAKITAWENLQKAKADASIRKLEMKLEKKRSSSMDRIIHKFQSAQKKAEEKRESILPNQPQRVAKPSHKATSLIKTCHVRLLTGCFTCPAL